MLLLFQMRLDTANYRELPELDFQFYSFINSKIFPGEVKFFLQFRECDSLIFYISIQCVCALPLKLKNDKALA